MPWILDTIWGAAHADISAFFHPRDSMVGLQVTAFRDPPEDRFPICIKVEKGPRPLPDLLWVAGAEYANARARAVLERFVPGGIAFREAEFLDARERPLRDRFWKITLGPNCLVDDGIAVEQSDVRMLAGNVKAPDGRILPLPPRLGVTREPPQLMWSRAAVGDRHIWADRLLQSRIVVSDELYGSMKAEKLTGFQAQECRFAQEH